MARYRPNLTFAREMDANPGFQRGMAAQTAEVAKQAQAAAPRKSGDYRASIKHDHQRVWTDDIAGHLIEFGSSKNPPYAPLRRGARAAGLRLTEAPKQ